ncbi:MAG: transposase [Thermodesulfovibrionia bacterium]|nr:transposase [Thermodesulfovibrionia bacterium]
MIFAENKDMKKGISDPRRSRLDSASWALLLEVQESSGLSVKDFCNSQGISVASFYQWRSRLQGGKVADGGLFSPIEIQEKPSGSITVELPGGILLRFSQLPPVDYLRDLSSKFSGY